MPFTRLNVAGWSRITSDVLWCEAGGAGAAGLVAGCGGGGVADEWLAAAGAGDGDGVGDGRVRYRAGRPRVWRGAGHDGWPGSAGGMGPGRPGGCLRWISSRAADSSTGEFWQMVFWPLRAIQAPIGSEQVMVQNGNAWRD